MEKPSIVIVEDDLIQLRLLSEILKPHGYDIHTASHGIEAIEIIENVNPHLILLDLMMPGMNGFEIVKRVKEFNSLDKTSVIFISGLGDADNRIQGFELGAVDFISKPFYTEEVLARVKTHVKIIENKRVLEKKTQNLEKQVKKGKLEEGDEFNNYKVLKLIGIGGMARVYKVKHIHLDNIIALKILNLPEDYYSEYTSRFIEEAKAIAQIKHQNIVEVFDAGLFEECYYIAMELIDGYNLEKIREKKELSFNLIHNIIYQSACGLAAAHEKNILHRDIKPSNIVVNRNMTVKILDFGLAKDLNKDVNLTASNVLVGTPAYMSPEQCLGGKQDFRSDIYSLGMTLYYLLTGETPFQGSNTCQTLIKNIEAPLPDPTKVRHIPEYMLHILYKMTQKEPDDRYQNTNDLLIDLRNTWT